MKKNTLLYLVFTLLFSGLLSSCGERKTSEELVSEAKVSIQTLKFEEASILLKNVIKLESKNIQARVLLGKVYIELGNGEGSEKELRRALELNGDRSEIVPLLIEAMMYIGDYDGVLNFIAIFDEKLTPDAEAKVQLYYAISLVYLSKINGAKDVISYLKNNDNTAYQKASSLFSALKNNDGEDLQLAIDALPVEALPKEILFLLGKIYLHNQNFTQATVMFTRYQGARSLNLIVNLYKAQSLLGEGKLEESEKLIDVVLTTVKEQPLANQIKGLISYKNEEYDDAVLHAEKAIQNGLAIDINRLVAGLSNYALNNFERTYQHLNIIKNSLARDNPARQILILTELYLGKTDNATETIFSSDTSLDNYNDLLFAAGNQFIRNDERDKAQSIATKASELNNKSNVDLARLGLMKTYLKDLSGLKDLEKGIANQPESYEHRIFLITALIHQRNLEKALLEVDQLIKLKPKAIMPYNLGGSIAVKLEMLLLAKQYFDIAETISSNNMLSQMFYAMLAEKENDFDTAYAHITNVLTEHPLYFDAIKKLYRLTVKMGSPKKALSLVESIVENNKDNIELKLNYAAMLFEEKNYRDVISVLKSIPESEELESTYWLFLGGAHAELNDFSSAYKVYDQWIKAKPKSGIALFKQVFLLERFAKNEEALNLIQSRIALNVENEYLAMMEAYFLIQTKQFLLGEEKLLLLNNETKKLSDYQGIMGLAKLGNKKFKSGLDYLLTAYQSNASSRYALAIHFAYLKTRNKEVANAFLESHIEKHPSDSAALITLANQYITSNSLKAIKYFEQALTLLPNQVIVLNNLAWLNLQKGNVSEAEEYIRRAVSLAPKNISFLDTFAQILLKNNKIDDAINIYSAFEKEGKLTDKYKVNFAKVLIANNDSSAARLIIDSINIADEVMSREIELLNKTIEKNEK